MLNQLSSEFNFENTDTVEAELVHALRENAVALTEIGLDVWRTRREAIAKKQAVFQTIEKRIEFIDQELSWVSSDQVAASLESERQALVDEHFQLNYPVSR